MQDLGDLGMKAFTLMEIVGFDVYGTPSKMVLDFDVEDDPRRKGDNATSVCGRIYPSQIRLNSSK